MKKILSLMLAILLMLSLVPREARGITQVTVTVNPPYRLDYGEYKIDFVTGEDLIGGTDSIIIQFPQESNIPCTSCAYGRCPECFKINGYNAGRVGLFDPEADSKTIYLEMPGGITVKKGENIEIVISQGAMFQNPSMPGKYTLTLWTTAEGKVQSDPFEILSTKVEGLSVTNDPETSSLIATYKIAFKTGSHGDLINGQNIYVELPEETYFPTVPHKNSVTINGENPQDISLNGNVYTLKLSYSINEGNDVLIYFLGSFGLQNPDIAGTYSINVWTDTEPEHVFANFTVIAQKTVSTQLEVIPQAPDGTNNIYRTTPSVTLTAETNTGEAVQTFYKIDAGDYMPYSNAITIPEGTHILYYYSKTPTLTESERSNTFKVDLTPPTISIDIPPQDPYYTGEQPLMVYGKVSEPSQIIVNNAVVLQNAEGGFASEITLVQGENIIQVKATDEAGWTSTKSTKVIYDTTVPILSVTEPNDFAKISTKEITVKGQVQPANTDVYVGDDKVSVNPDGSFEYSYAPKVSGSLFAIKVSATYPFSKKTVSKLITVIYEPSTSEVLLKIGDKSAMVNGKNVNMDTAPFIDTKVNRTYVPARFVAEFLNGSVLWNGATKTITISLGQEIKLTVGSGIAYINGKPIKLDVPVFIKDNRSFVPLRFIAENLGFKVEWNGNDKTIKISKP
jgi:hypothetical protein